MDPDLPKDCPVNNPKSEMIHQEKVYPRVCPMTTPVFIERMKSVEDGLKLLGTRLDEDQQTRHERNTIIYEVIDEERIERMKLEDSVKTLVLQQTELLGVIKGSWHDEGLFKEFRKFRKDVETWTDKIEKIDNIDERVKHIESRYNVSKGFINGATFIISLIASAIGAIIGIIGAYFKFKG